MDSETPTQSIDKKNRFGDLHLAFVMDKEAVKEHAQWWKPELKETICTQTRLAPGASVFVGGGGPVFSAWVAEECNRILEQELTEGEERTFSDLVKKAREKELEALGHFRVFSPILPGTQEEDLRIRGGETVKARLAVEGFQDPDLRMGNVVITGSVSLRPSHLQVISLGALRQWPLRSLETKNAFLQADGFGRDVLLRAPCEWNSKESRRVWKLQAPAYGLNDAPAAFRRPLRKYLVNSVHSLSTVGLRFEVSSFDRWLHFVYRKLGSAVGAITTHIDDLLGCGEDGLLVKVRGYSEKRFGKLEVQEGSCVHVGVELAQEKDFSVTLTQADFTKNMK